MNVDEMPCAISFSERFDYDVRAEAWRIMGGGHGVGVGVDITLSHPKLPEVLLCLAAMAAGGLVQFYGGYDTELAYLAASREFRLCDQLANAEAELLQNPERTTTLRLTQPDPQQVELAAARAECQRITSDTMELRSHTQAQRPAYRHPTYLPSDTPVSPTLLRALAIQRQRDVEEE